MPTEQQADSKTLRTVTKALLLGWLKVQEGVTQFALKYLSIKKFRLEIRESLRNSGLNSEKHGFVF